LNRYEKKEEERKSRFLTQAVSVGSRGRLNQTQNWSWNYYKVRNRCFVSNLTNPINKMFMTLIYFKNSKILFSYRLVCYFFVLTTFWRHLWSITEQSTATWNLFDKWEGNFKPISARIFLELFLNQIIWATNHKAINTLSGHWTSGVWASWRFHFFAAICRFCLSFAHIYS